LPGSASSWYGVPAARGGFDLQFDFDTRAEAVDDSDQAIDRI
jgi:hypothetical protein